MGKELCPAPALCCSGGQWPQTRKARVPKWNISDTRCQLCYEANGTLEHRYDCRFVKPTAGWSKLPEKAKLAAGRVGPERLRMLRTTGFLALKLPALPQANYDSFDWLTEPPDMLRTDVRWYIDGSMMNARWRQYSSCG